MYLDLILGEGIVIKNSLKDVIPKKYLAIQIAVHNQELDILIGNYHLNSNP
jgi:hypothetical protein